LLDRLDTYDPQKDSTEEQFFRTGGLSPSKWQTMILAAEQSEPNLAERLCRLGPGAPPQAAKNRQKLSEKQVLLVDTRLQRG
jgi:hypothetical protein